MKKLAIDTNVYVAFMRGDETIIELMQHTDLIAVNTIVLGELLAGFAVGSKTAKNRKELSQFLNTPRVEIFHPDESTANYYAEIYKSLRQKGYPIPTNDLWIAALSLQHGHLLCTLDKHFSAVDNLVICKNIMELLP